MSVECHLWWADAATWDDVSAPPLSADEQARATEYVDEQARAEFRCGASLLRTAARSVGATRGGTVRVERRCPDCPRPHGRPVLPGTPWHASISHSAGLVSVVLTRAGQVGVDIERERDLHDAGLVGLVLAPGEERPAPRDVLRVWTRKEAVLKATGTGLRTPLGSIRVSPAGRPARVEELAGSSAADWTLTDLACPDGWIASLAVHHRGPVVVRRWT